MCVQEYRLRQCHSLIPRPSYEFCQCYMRDWKANGGPGDEVIVRDINNSHCFLNNCENSSSRCDILHSHVDVGMDVTGGNMINVYS